jgi:hypothetical protein
MKTQANKIKEQNKIDLGHGKILTVKEISETFQKNGKKIIVFKGSTNAHVIKSKNMPTYNCPAFENYVIDFKENTLVKIL